MKFLPPFHFHALRIASHDSDKQKESEVIFYADEAYYGESISGYG